MVGVLAGHQPQPSTELGRRLELREVAHACHQGRGGDGANTG